MGRRDTRNMRQKPSLSRSHFCGIYHLSRRQVSILFAPQAQLYMHLITSSLQQADTVHQIVPRADLL